MEKTMNNELLKLKQAIINAITALVVTGGVSAGTLDFATRISCELQTASGTSLSRMTWQQGTTPLLSVEQFRLGKAIAADTRRFSRNSGMDFQLHMRHQ
jgi:hypothetical protein